jgi:hypothetical protein
MLVESLPQGTRIQLHFQREDQRIRLLPAPKDARVDEEAP